MAIDFSEHFWGDKHQGFSVLYQNMKHGQNSVKELLLFLKERATAEEEYHKRLVLLNKQISTYGVVGVFAPVWQIVRISLEKLAQLHIHLVQKLHDLSKEVQKYCDEQSKQQKEVKEREGKTFDAVNYIQTTTTCLQKARENYIARCVEHEKLKKENASAKELSKSETRTKKASEEYRQYVDKYGKVRDDFEDRMISASRAFQEIETSHVNQMKSFLSNYGQSVNSSYALLKQVHETFVDDVEAIDIDSLFQEFVAKKGTGMEKPPFYFYEEADVLGMVSPSSVQFSDDTAVASSESSPIPGLSGRVSPSCSDPFEQSLASSVAPTPAASNQSSSQPRKLALWLPGRSNKNNRKTTNAGTKGQVVTPSPSSHELSLAATDGKTEGTPTAESLAALSVAAVALSSSESDAFAAPPSPIASANGVSTSYALFGSCPTGDDIPKVTQSQTATQKRRERSLSMGFLRKKKDKKKKDKDGDNRSVQSNEDAKSKTSAESSEGNSAHVDREGFSVIPEGRQVNDHDKDKDDDSTSDSDSDDEQPQKIQVKINPLSQDMVKKNSASVDELRDAIGNMSSSISAGALKTKPSSRANDSEFSLDFFDPIPRQSESTTHPSVDPWQPINRINGDTKLLRPAKTGDDRYNNRNFAGGWDMDMQPPTGPPPPPPTGAGWAEEEAGDRLTNLSSSNLFSNQSLASGVARSRPRSTTPTHMITLSGTTALKRSLGGSGCSFSSTPLTDTPMSRSDSIGSLDMQHMNTISSSGSSNYVSNTSRSSSPLQATGDSIPLAMAATETVHALFKRANEQGCVIRVYGNIAVSFPAGIVQALAASLFSSPSGAQRPPMTFQLEQAERITALLPNRQVLTQNSTFKPDACHKFEFTMPGLIAQLKKLADASPNQPFYNLDVLRYEVKVLDSVSNSRNSGDGDQRLAPLLLRSFWKCDADHTDIRIDYRYNPDCPFSAPLLNLVFYTDVNGGVSQVHSKPEANWNAAESRLSWRLTELSRHGESSGSLKARLSLTNGPSTPARTLVQFQVNENTLSGAELQLNNDGPYRLSLLKKKLVSGKYLCEPEIP